MITFANEGVHPYSAFDTSCYLYGDRQDVYNPRTTPIPKTKR